MRRVGVAHVPDNAAKVRRVHHVRVVVAVVDRVDAAAHDVAVVRRHRQPRRRLRRMVRELRLGQPLHQQQRLVDRPGRGGRVDVREEAGHVSLGRRGPEVVADERRFVRRELDLLLLELGAVHSVLAKQEVRDAAVGAADRLVVLAPQVLHRLDELALNVACLRRLDGRVNEPDAAAHRVEKELVGREAVQVRVLHKAAGLEAVVVLAKVGEGAVLEGVGDALALDRLLAEAANHLGNVNGLALAPGVDHILEPARVRLQNLLGGVVANLVRGALDNELLVRRRRLARLVLEAAVVDALHLVLDRLFTLLHDLLDLLLDLVAHHQVAHAHREAAVVHVGRHHPADVVNQVARRRRAAVLKGHVHQPLRLRRERLLADRPALHHAVADDALLAQVDVERIRQDARVRLVARHVRARRRLARGLELAPRLGRPHQRVHKLPATKGARRLLAEQVRAQHRVLDGRDARRRLRGANELPVDGRERLELRRRLHRLRHVHVHLVAVKVGVVRARRVDAQAERLAQVHRLDAVAHHRHLVQRRLAVEQDRVAGQQVPVDDVANLQVVRLLLQQVAVVVAREELERQPPAVGLLDDARARVLVRARADHPPQPLQVERVDALGERHVHTHIERHAQLVQLEERVGRDDRPRRKVDALAHQVPADAALLGLEPLPNRLEGPAAPLLGLVDAALVVNERRHVVLEDVPPALDHPRVDGRVRLRNNAVLGVLLLARHLVEFLFQHLVALDNVNVLVREVVLRPRLLALLLDRRAHAGGRDRKHRANHPLGARVLRVKANEPAVVVREALEQHLHVLGRHEHLALGLLAARLVARLGPLGEYLEVLLLVHVLVGLLAVAHRAVRARRLVVLDELVHLRVARRVAGERPNGGELLGAEVAVHAQRPAAKAHHLEDALNPGHKLDVVHGHRELHMAKVAGALLLVEAVRRAHDAVLEDAHLAVKQAPGTGDAAAIVEALLGDLDDRTPPNLLGRQERELDALDLLHAGRIVRVGHRVVYKVSGRARGGKGGERFGAEWAYVRAWGWSFLL